MEAFNIAITGNVGAGKTSFIKTISEIEVVSTEKKASDEVNQLKHNTTVALDFGRLTLNAEQVLYLYGTPGQNRFDFMWEIIIEKAHAYIVLIDAHRPQDFYNGRRIFNFMQSKVNLPMIIGLTHTDCEGAWEADDVALALGLKNRRRRPPIITVNASDSSSVANSLICLLEQLMMANV
ncbi:conserved hypothetical protein [Hyella patelloides LEGE 07179]|uniref:GTPase n=1 Tax=Hyella patelloides LEGE 07179 TaxID=945734 RepID=A0A563W0M8_9CYAN|nr:ATP/GTP-binding protein [Hyella patelloides]VEP17258.1 conserved hypothetical protein [Hyella patelloides LEGE 07179]